MNTIEKKNNPVSWIGVVTEDVHAHSEKLSAARQVFAVEWMRKCPITELDSPPELILLKQPSREWLGDPENRRFDSTTMLTLQALREIPELLETQDGFILPGQLVIAVEHSMPMHMEVRLQNLARQSIELRS